VTQVKHTRLGDGGGGLSQPSEANGRKRVQAPAVSANRGLASRNLESRTWTVPGVVAT